MKNVNGLEYVSAGGGGSSWGGGGTVRGPLKILAIPRDSLRQKFLPQIQKGAFLDLRHVFLICGVFLELRQNLFSVFSTPRFAAEIGKNAAEIGGNAAEIPGKQTELRRFCFGCGVFLCLRLIFCNAAGISAAMRCGRNFRRRKF